MNMPVFVYGTLKYGESNSYILRNSIFVGTFKTDPKYNLHDLGPFPAVVPDGNVSVIGEVYLVDNDTMEKLDFLEGYPDFYDKELTSVYPIKIESDNFSNIKNAIIYFIPKDKFDYPESKILESGIW